LTVLLSIEKACAKLKVRSRIEAVAVAVRSGWSTRRSVSSWGKGGRVWNFCTEAGGRSLLHFVLGGNAAPRWSEAVHNIVRAGARRRVLANVTLFRVTVFLDCLKRGVYPKGEIFSDFNETMVGDVGFEPTTRW